MEKLSHQTERWLVKKQAEDFLRQLGFTPTKERIRRFAAHLIHFEKQDLMKTAK